MEMIGDVQTSVKRYSKGREEEIEVSEKGSLWVLFIKQSLQEYEVENDWENGKENCEIIVFRIGRRMS